MKQYFTLIMVACLLLVSFANMTKAQKSAEELATDKAIIQRVVNSVDSNNIKATIYDLQENVQLDPPNKHYRSRFTLRVKNTDNPSDDALDNVAEYIFRKFKSYGLSVEYDPFNMQNPAVTFAEIKGNYEAKNVVATLPGTGPNKDKVYIICGHYDSIAANNANFFENWKTMDAPGAWDNASGVAGVIEIARILSKERFDATIKFVTFAGHELGLFGSRHYIQAFGGKEQIAGVFVMDGIGYDPDTWDILVIGNDKSEWIVNNIETAKEYYKIDIVIEKLLNPYSKPWGGDAWSFWDAGYNVVFSTAANTLAPPEIPPFYHTSKDTLDTFDVELTSRIVKLNIATLTEIAGHVNAVPTTMVSNSGNLVIMWGQIKKGEF